jgi:hypothetical protein
MSGNANASNRLNSGPSVKEREASDTIGSPLRIRNAET